MSRTRKKKDETEENEETPEEIAYSCIGVWKGDDFLPRDACRLGKWFIKPDIACCNHCLTKEPALPSIELDSFRTYFHKGNGTFSNACFDCYTYHSGFRVRLFGRCISSENGTCPNLHHN